MSTYRTAFVVENKTFDFSPLLEHCSNIRFITTGYEEEKDLLGTISSALDTFVPEIDLIVPVGSLYATLLVGMVLYQICKPFQTLNVALYRDRTYHLLTMDLHELLAQEERRNA